MFFAKLFKTIFGATEKLPVETEVVSEHDRIWEECRGNIKKCKSSVARLIISEEEKKAELVKLTVKLTQLEKIKSASMSKAKGIADSLKLDPDAAKKDSNYLTCFSAFKNATEEIHKKTKEVEKLECDIRELSTNIAAHRVKLVEQISDLKIYKYETQAAFIAHEEKNVAALFSSMSENITSQELEEMRSQRMKGKAEARLNREMAGLYAKDMDYASDVAVEFDKAIFNKS